MQNNFPKNQKNPDCNKFRSAKLGGITTLLRIQVVGPCWFLVNPFLFHVILCSNIEVSRISKYLNVERFWLLRITEFRILAVGILTGIQSKSYLTNVNKLFQFGKKRPKRNCDRYHWHYFIKPMFHL